MNYRNLTIQEIKALEKQGCFGTNWSLLQVAEAFSTKNIHQVRFDGEVKLGALAGQSSSKPVGLYSSFIKNCEIAEDVYVANVGTLEGYIIESDVVIENVSSLKMEGESAFGNGTEIEVLNEGGGREIRLFDRLSSQMAYLLVQYRHEPAMIANLESLILKYCDRQKSKRGLIQTGTVIRDSQIIRNTKIGPMVTISGTQHLEEGTITGSKEAPTFIGTAVIAKNFIVLSGSQLDSGAVLDKCFVGQGVKIGKQFSAENSTFFANCEGFHGEAVSLFAGPYTVTHHKSTLLIAALLSFYNAGSGTNQSNHMYKLGPLHQGIMERGCKTGSFSYLLWPARVGAFSVVMDKHGSNFDTSEFPFSYITVEGGKSMLTPAMNLITVGTKRDCEKWPNRDRRKDSDKLDLICFELFNPYIVGKIIRAAEILQGLYEKASKKQKIVIYKGITIYRLLLKTCRNYYLMALKKYYGEQLLSHLEKKSFNSLEEVRSFFPKNEKIDITNWIDMAGLLAPDFAVNELVETLKSGQLKKVEEAEDALKKLHGNYEQYTWNWYATILKKQLDIDPTKITKEQLIELVDNWKVNSLKLNNMILKDAMKEFSKISKIGFGIDGGDEVREADFTAVRGTYEDNSFIRNLQAENQAIEEKAAGWIEKFEKL
ncbi:MAG: DUF4954 family protein [Bacteroidetes bacterium]|nr:DUF4954 family protein [Bacteroidota bacterium]